tara:strand:- start:554 stop:916 length:363 start_codon:yes stop_codon:yes gene_type:complete
MSLICKKTVEERLEELETRIIELEKLLVKGKRGPPLKKHINSNNITIKEKIHLLKVFNTSKIWIILYNKDQTSDIPILETDIGSIIKLRNSLMSENLVGFDSFKLINRFAKYEANVWSLV